MLRITFGNFIHFRVLHIFFATASGSSGTADARAFSGNATFEPYQMENGEKSPLNLDTQRLGQRGQKFNSLPKSCEIFSRTI